MLVCEYECMNVCDTEELGEAGSAGGEGKLVLGPVLGTAQMRGDGNARAVLEEVLDGGDRGADAWVGSGER